MSNYDLIQRRRQDQDIHSLDTLRRLRRNRAEAEVAIAKLEVLQRRNDRVAAATARADAASHLARWNSSITTKAYEERIRLNASMSQPIFEFNSLSAKLRQLEFAEFAAKRRESLAGERLTAVLAFAKTAAVSHEKIVECRK